MHRTDRLITVIVLVILGLLAMATVVGGIYLTAQDKSLPGELIAIGSLAAGAIAAILSRPNGEEVRVINEPDEPVPVDAGQTGVNLLVVFVVGFLLGWLSHAAGLFT